MAENPAALIRSVLSSPNSEPVIKQQMIEIARLNLHQPDVVAALVAALPAIPDKETRDLLLGLLLELDTSRFDRLDEFHASLMTLFKQEKERAVRAALLRRLSQALHQDERLAPFLIGILAQPILSDDERREAMQAVAKMPAISEATAALALDRAARAPSGIQATAVALAEGCPKWGDAIVAALQPYLDVKVERAIRVRILKRLAQAKALTPAALPLLAATLRSDPDRDARAAALDLLHSIKPWDEPVLRQLLWTASNDADAGLRARAVALQGEAPELSDEQIARLAGQLASDSCAGVRTRVMGVLKDFVRRPEIRAAAAQAFAGNPSAFDDSEFDALVALLSPYVGRDAAVTDTLLSSVERLPRAEQRRSLLEAVLPKVKPEQAVPWLAKAFGRERNEALRQTLFESLKPLSVARHPELVAIFCGELTEPSSTFRQECAEALGGASELYPEIAPALEDVLLHDQDRELVRVCVEGYLKPRVARKFEPMLAVVRNEVVDVRSRQACLDELFRGPLTAEQQQALTEAISGLKPGSLRVPR